MNKVVRYTLAIGLILIVSVSVAFSAGTKKSLDNIADKGRAHSEKAFTAIASATDTLVYVREPNVSALTFYIKTLDSINFTRVTLRRVYGTTTQPQVATIDTLSLFTSLDGSATATAPPIYQTQAVTMAPYPDIYYFVISVASGAVGTNYTTYSAGVNKVYNYKTP